MSRCGYPSPTGHHVMTPLAALPTAPGHARAHVRAALLAWDMSALAETAELVATELVTNAVRASERPGGSLSCQDRQTPMIGICLLADGARLRIEVWDQAVGFPVPREASADSECGRGLALVDAVTEGRWGWHPAARPQPAKCVWAEIGPPNPETGRRNMTTTETELAPPTAASVNLAHATITPPGKPLSRPVTHPASAPPRTGPASREIGRGFGDGLAGDGDALSAVALPGLVKVAEADVEQSLAVGAEDPGGEEFWQAVRQVVLPAP